MPRSGTFGNTLSGLSMLPLKCTGVTNAGQTFAHGMGSTPAMIFAVQIKDGAAAVTATLNYDRANSDATNIKLWTDTASSSDWLVVPIGGVGF